MPKINAFCCRRRPTGETAEGGLPIHWGGTAERREGKQVIRVFDAYLLSFCYLCAMKLKINWKMFLVFFIVIGGLYYLTRNVWVAAGIMVLLLLADGLIRQYELKKKGERQAEEILKGLTEKEEKEGEEEEK
ncbi:hypothetical protein [Prevotella sp. HUN102]|uniref:hypothetical protein n=1 Tax=Prevotella sp. HUN102 TaxID=1392486 RepID=UPI00350FBE5A